jgi:hypothetical protein
MGESVTRGHCWRLVWTSFSCILKEFSVPNEGLSPTNQQWVREVMATQQLP